jgi:hypothetical protein
MTLAKPSSDPRGPRGTTELLRQALAEFGTSFPANAGFLAALHLQKRSFGPKLPLRI